ncbi:DUF6114 domain-containing protein [Streptosporangium sp. LJ11]|uniref:DUF6114 domain-containing protein n=1 Tax=Streptosporangium sp. LJ11 TaxID=3436927 RepID=UPI003F79D933
MKSWRNSRPFWGGLLIVLAGAELLSIPFTLNALSVSILFSAVGATYLIALVMMISGVLVWLQPGQRVFLGLMAVLLSMASFVYSNLGGFLIGMSLGLLGGTLAIAWTPLSRPAGRLDSLSVRDFLDAARALVSKAKAMRAAIGPGSRRWRKSPTKDTSVATMNREAATTPPRMATKASLTGEKTALRE